MVKALKDFFIYSEKVKDNKEVDKIIKVNTGDLVNLKKEYEKELIELGYFEKVIKNAKESSDSIDNKVEIEEVE